MILQLARNTQNIVNRCHSTRVTGLDEAECLNRKPHFIAKVHRGHSKNCLVCSTEKKRKTTMFFCETYSKKPKLHPGKCFKSNVPSKLRSCAAAQYFRFAAHCISIGKTS